MLRRYDSEYRETVLWVSVWVKTGDPNSKGEGGEIGAIKVKGKGETVTQEESIVAVGQEKTDLKIKIKS